MTERKRAEDPDELREMVKGGYARIAESSAACYGGAPPQAAEHGRRIGYSDEQLSAAPEGANLGLGCGNPTGLASLRSGEVVLDLGSGAGFDAFLAARAVGPGGRVIGVDMTDAMLEKARENARQGGFDNVEFRKGTIESLPVESESIDAILSNCVINLSPEKESVFREAYRVLRPGGRLSISDIVLECPLPQAVIESVEAYLGCVGGAVLRTEYLETVAKAGFREIRITGEARFADAVAPDHPELREFAERFELEDEQVKEILGAVTSIHVQALK